MIAAVTEAISIAILALFCISGWLKASRVMKIDIVKPIPPKNPTDSMCFKLMLLGSLKNLAFTPNQLKRNMPIGFPNKSPRIIPMLYGWDIIWLKLPFIIIAVLASANIGIMK